MAESKRNKRGTNPEFQRAKFKKGDPSANKDGRPKGSLNRSTIIRKVLDNVVIGEIGGERKKLKLSEAVLMKLAQKALTGDSRAMGMILNLWEESEERMEREREAEYPFRDEIDRQVIDEMYTRMKASGA